MWVENYFIWCRVITLKTEPVLNRGDIPRVEVEEGCPAQVAVKLFHSTDEHLEVGPVVTDRDVLVTVIKHNGFHLDLKRAQLMEQIVTFTFKPKERDAHWEQLIN